MIKATDIGTFVDEAAHLTSPRAFNPYSEVCAVADWSESPFIRRNNLQSILTACSAAEVCSLWIGRDLGYRGGRRTGVALTDEIFLNQYAHLVGATNVRKATRGPSMPERTAHIVQNLLLEINKPVFMWNIFPLHPYDEKNQFSNRKHTASERDMGVGLIERLISILNVDTIVAIGRDAQDALRGIGVNFVPARHPSYGGQREFLDAVRNLYRVGRAEDDQPRLL